MRTLSRTESDQYHVVSELYARVTVCLFWIGGDNTLVAPGFTVVFRYDRDKWRAVRGHAARGPQQEQVARAGYAFQREGRRGF